MFLYIILIIQLKFPQDVISLTSGTRAHGDVWEGVKGPFRSWSRDRAHTSDFGKRFNKGVLLMVVVCGLVSMDECAWLTRGSHG